MFGKAFATRKEAKEHLAKLEAKGERGNAIRKMDKRLFPRRKKLFHVGSGIDFLNFA